MSGKLRAPTVRDMTDVEIAWLAGLIEGEGTFSLVDDKRDNAAARLTIAVEMTDLDVLGRIADITGAGKIYGPRKRSATRKPVWKWAVTAQADVVVLLNRLLPHLGQRRSARVLALLAYFHARGAQ